jgi:hypothetical protein
MDMDISHLHKEVGMGLDMNGMDTDMSINIKLDPNFYISMCKNVHSNVDMYINIYMDMDVDVDIYINVYIYMDKDGRHEQGLKYPQLDTDVNMIMNIHVRMDIKWLRTYIQRWASYFQKVTSVVLVR